MAGVLKRSDWNDIIQQVNDLSSNPDAGCDPIEPPLEEVGPDHKWSKTDISTVQDRLKEICEENEFDEIPDLWKQRTIDEINEAIARGWCDCEKCQAEDETLIIHEVNPTCLAVGVNALELPCEGILDRSTCPESQSGSFDWYTFATGVTGFGNGFGGGMRVRRIITVPPGRDGGSNKLLYFNTFLCDGSQKTPLPTRPTLSDGTLRDSTYSTVLVSCVECTPREESCWLFWCATQPCVFGMYACDIPEQYAAAQTLLEDFQRFCDVEFPRTVRYVLEKFVDSGFHGEGAPCQRCCQGNPAGFYPIDCPEEVPPGEEGG
jgi:hypothetical protein